jgi:hypothetical protein
MKNLHFEILDAGRRAIWPSLSRLPKGGVLGGGTSLALQIGHRKSFDFDFFYSQPIKKNWLIKLRDIFGKKLLRPTIDSPDELTVILDPDIKLTLLHYPFPHLHKPRLLNGLKILDVRDVASSKAYAVGRRGAWRDYVDIFFLLKNHLSLKTIIGESKKRFQGVFDSRLFLQQLVYFDDLDDKLVDLVDPKISDKQIKNFLTKAVEDYVSTAVV